jgi:hypothetical protein
MPTAWPIAALVVPLIIRFMSVLFASVLCRMAIRRDVQFEADVGIALVRFKVGSQQQPDGGGRSV